VSLSESIAADSQPDGFENGQRQLTALSRLEQAGLIISLCIGVLAVAFEQFAINAVMPKVASPSELNDMSRYAWAFTLFVLGQAFAIIVVGRLVDRFGAFKPLAAGMAIFALGLVLAGSAHQMTTFLAARVVQGLGGGTLNISLMVIIAEVFPEKRRSVMMSIFSFCYLLPAFMGPPLAGIIAAGIGWRWVFWLIVPLVVVSSAIGFRSVFRLYRDRPARPDHADVVPVWVALAGTIGMGLLQAAWQELSHNKDAFRWDVIVVFAVFGLVAVGIALSKLMPPGFWKLQPGMPALMWVRMTLAGAFFASASFITLLLHEDRGLSLAEASWSLSIGALGWTAGTLLQMQRWLKLRRDQIIMVGAYFTAAGIGLLAIFAGWPKVPLIVAIAALLLAGFGMGMSSPSTSLALMTLSPPEAIGHNTSGLQVADNLGSAFFAGVAGSFMAAMMPRVGIPITFGWMYTINAGVVVIAIILTRRMGRVRNEASGVG